MTGRLVLVGSVVVDLIMTVPALPERGGDVLAGAAVAQAGGGFNVLAAAARLGLPAALLGRVGGGPLGDVVAGALAGEGVDLLLPRSARGDTGLCVGFVEPDAERTFVTSTGVEGELRPADLAAARLRPGDLLYVSGYDLAYPVSGPAIAAWLPGQPVAGVFLDPGPLAADIPGPVLDAVLAATTVLSVNARELEMLGGSPVGLLRRCAPGAVLLARDGARGCTVWSHDPSQAGRLVPVTVPSQEVLAVDSTGAGDAHAGAYLAGLSQGLGPVAAAGLANAAAAYAVARAGSATGPTTEQLDAFRAGL